MTGTTVASDPSAPPPLPPPTRRGRGWRIAGGVALAAAATVFTAANFVTVPYVIVSPGDATQLDERVVSVSGVPTYANEGELLFLTVRLSNSDPSVLRWALSHLDNDVSIVKKQDYGLACTSYEDSARLNDLLMRQSQDDAKTVALRHLGYDVKETGERTVIIDVLCGGPSEERIQLGDEVLAVDGKEIVTQDDVRPLVQAHPPGEDVELTLRRDDRERTVTLRTGKLTEDPRHPCVPVDGQSAGTAKSCIGVQSQTISDEIFPVDIDIDTRTVSGPSAGLAFTLAIIDQLTPGSLTGGKRVAVTGSIVNDGHVLPVGGIEQKTVAARQHGATLMLVPKGEAKAARERAGDMRVVAVDTIEDALEALRRAGGDPVSRRQPPQ